MCARARARRDMWHDIYVCDSFMISNISVSLNVISLVSQMSSMGSRLNSIQSYFFQIIIYTNTNTKIICIFLSSIVELWDSIIEVSSIFDNHIYKLRESLIGKGDYYGIWGWWMSTKTCSNERSCRRSCFDHARRIDKVNLGPYYNNTSQVN